MSAGRRSPRADVRVFGHAAAAAHAAKDELLRIGRAAIAAKGRYFTAVSGGSTPRALYSSLEADELPWEKVEVFFVDERCVPPDDPDSNFGMVRETLLARVPIPAANVHRIRGEAARPEDAAAEYEEELRRVFGAKDPGPPRFDFLLLGLGADGHTASLFPRSSALGESTRDVIAARAEHLRTPRVTLTLRVLNGAAAIRFLVVGRDKAGAVAAALRGEGDPLDCPARLVAPQRGTVTWLLDRQAAAVFDLPR